MVTGGAGIGENLYIGGTLNVASNTSLNGNATLGDATADIVTITGTIAGGTPLVFEGATANDFETSFAITDPTADRTITFPDVSGTVITTGNTSDLATLAWLVGGNTITGGTTTRKIGIATQAANDDGLAIMTDGTDRLTITAAGVSTFSGTLTSTGDFAVGASTFSVTAASGNTSVGGTLGVTGATSLNGNATLGDNASDVVTVTGTIAGATPLVFEGATANGFETSFAITDPTAARTITFPDVDGTVITTGNLGSITGFVPYNTTSALTTADANGTAYLFNVAYDGAATGNALGARIASDATGGTNASATGLTLSAVGTGIGTATGLTVSASGPGTNKAINVTAGGIDVDAGGLNVDAGGITVTGTSSIDGATTITGGDLTLGAAAATSGGSIVLHDDDNTTSFTATVKAANHAASRTYSIPDAGAAASFVMTEGNQTLNGQTTLAATTTFQSALKFPFIRNTTAGAYTVAANDFVVIQTVNGAINLPAGVDGRMLILKNTAAGATINITPNGAQTCDAATLAEGASITLIYNGGNWYQVGN
jgi:hypothetical protein